jgi:TM2 domain-containing membrane protein YozV
VADSLFATGNYLEARVGYERLLFSGSENVNLLLLKKSYCFKAESKFEEAYEMLQRADFFGGEDSIRFQLYYECALNSFLAHRYDLSLNKLQELHYYFPSKTNQAMEILEILTLNQMKKWDEAEKKYDLFISKNSILTTEATALYKEQKPRKLKNPDKAETLSLLFPGAGQMYAGYVGQGLTSFGIQAGLVTFAIYSFVNGFYFSGAFTGVGLFYMFYNGGARHAKYLAEKRNHEKMDEFNEEVKQILSGGIKK